MLRQTDEKLQQIESGLKKAGMQLPGDVNVKMNLAERMTHYKVPSVSIAVIDENEVKLTKTYDAPPDTVYQAASVSKPVSALVALLVAKKYKLDLDENVNRILERCHSTYRVPNSAFTSTDTGKVTLRRLLSHTAGLTVGGFTGYASDTQELPTTQQILEGEKSTSPTNSKPVESFAIPGTECRYSGGGTTLMQLILEEVTKEEFPGVREKFPAIARKYVLDPLEMKSSGYEIHRPGEEEKFHPAVANDRDGNPVKGKWNLYPESAAAGLWSTPADLARFVIEIQKAYKGESDKIPQDVAQAMLTKQVPGKYGLGPEVDVYDTSLSFSHGGSNKGFRCFFTGFVNGKGAVIMTNSDKGTNLIEEIIPAIAAAYEWPAHDYSNAKIKRPVTIDSTIYEEYVDKYLIGEIPFEFITKDNEFFVLLPYPQPNDSVKEFKLTPESETSFFHISNEARLEFVFPSRKADTFTCSLTPDPGVRITKELKNEAQGSEVLPSVESKSPQISLSSTSPVGQEDKKAEKSEAQISASTVETFLKGITEPDGTINLSTLKKIGGGGTHDVYRSEKYPDLVLKVMKRTTGEDEAKLSENLLKLDKQCSMLYETFDPSRCIVEKHSIQTIKSNDSESPKKTIVSIVPFEPCFESQEKFGFNVEPAERDGRLVTSKRYLYEMVNRAFLGGEDKPSAYVMRNYTLLNKDFENIFKLLDTDESLKIVMREFLEKYRLFYQKHGILLDTIGLDNVLFYKSDGAWQFKLGSVIKHDTGALTKKMLDEINKNPAIVNESFESFTSIFFMPACIRALNACAEKVGMSKVIDNIILDERTIKALAEMHVQLGEAHRIENYLEHKEFSTALKLYREYPPEPDEKSYNSRLRDSMGTRYWEFIKQGGKETSRDEVQAYLEILQDKRNKFPDFRKNEVEAAIVGLTEKLRSLDNVKSNKMEHKAPVKLFDSSDPKLKRENESDKEYVARLARIRRGLR